MAEATTVQRVTEFRAELETRLVDRFAGRTVSEKQQAEVVAVCMDAAREFGFLEPPKFSSPPIYVEMVDGSPVLKFSYEATEILREFDLG